MARKMSSPKKRPMLSVAAAKARTLWASAGATSATPVSTARAASAMGAMIGRMVWVWPAMEVRPRAEVACRKRR